MRQRLANPKLKWWQGILLILGIILILFAGQFAAAAYTFYSGFENAPMQASVVFWIFGIILAVVVIRYFVMEYEYTLEGLAFRIDRIYGGMRPRMAVQVVTRKIRFVGTPEDAQAKYPGAHPSNYTRAKADIEVLVVAYEDKNGVRLLNIQPGDKMRARLYEIAKENNDAL
jgi:hypothetical protein